MKAAFKSQVLRIRSSNLELARRLFTMMATVFGEATEPLGDEYLERLLGRGEFWAFCVVVGGEVIGGLTAYALEFYRALGGVATSVTMFTFTPHQAHSTLPALR